MNDKRKAEMAVSLPIESHFRYYKDVDFYFFTIVRESLPL